MQVVRLVLIGVTTITNTVCGMVHSREMALTHYDISNSTAWVKLLRLTIITPCSHRWPFREKERKSSRKYLIHHTPSQKLNTVDSTVTSYNGYLLLELKSYTLEYTQFVEPIA
jgi:hypothetical protein